MSVEAMTKHGGGGASPDDTRSVSLYSIQVQAQIVAYSPIGIMSRVALTRAVAETLLMPIFGEKSRTIALLYVVNAGTPGAANERVRTYIRCHLLFESSSLDGSSLAAMKRRLMRQAFEWLDQQLLQVGYALKPVSRIDLTACQQAIRAGRAAELAYTRLRHIPVGLAPVQVQPTLDLLVSRASSAALQFAVEWQPSDAIHGFDPSMPRLRLGIEALGSAATPGALRLLARELRGRGVLVARELLPGTKPLKLKVFRPQSAAERAHICDNFSAPAAEPWPQTIQPVEMEITLADAAVLLPLPFALID